MSVHVIVQYTKPQYWRDEETLSFGWDKGDCFYEGDVNSVEWADFVLKLGRRKIYANEYFCDSEKFDDEELWKTGNMREINLLEANRNNTDIQYLKVGDIVLRDVRETRIERVNDENHA